MFCKECGVENQDDSLNCKSCGVFLSTIDSPLNGGDRVKIVLYFVLWCMSLFFGIIPILISFISIYIMKKDKSFRAIDISKTVIDNYIVLVGIGIMIGGGSQLNSDKDVGVVFLVIGFTVLFALIPLLNYLYFSTLEKHKNWVVQNGIFADKQNEKSILLSVSEGIKNIKGQSCNIADELLKWGELQEKGIITQEEFEREKQKLLNKGKA